METKIKNAWQFLAELQKFSTYCTKVKSKTARKKAEEFFDNHRHLFISAYELENFKNTRDAFYCQKSGFISYEKNGEKFYLKISEVEQYSYKGDILKLKTSNIEEFFDTKIFTHLPFLFKK